MSDNVVSTPTQERCVTSYAARTQYKPGVVHPGHIKVKDAIDIHCHAHAGQQDALDLVKKASRAEMKGILFKSIVGKAGTAVRELQAKLDGWAAEEGATPVALFAGFVCGRNDDPVPRNSPRRPSTTAASPCGCRCSTTPTPCASWAAAGSSSSTT